MNCGQELGCSRYDASGGKVDTARCNGKLTEQDGKYYNGCVDCNTCGATERLTLLGRQALALEKMVEGKQ